MGKTPLSNELIVQILREFVVEHSGKWVHPDICDKAAAAIEALQAEVKKNQETCQSCGVKSAAVIEALQSQNKKLRNALVGSCCACKHQIHLGPDSPCETCFRSPRGTTQGLHSMNNWEWNPDLDSPSPTSNDPLPMEALHGMTGKPYWHVGLRPESEPPHWAILPDNVAKYPQDYHYGEYWLAYLQETEKKEADDENPDA